MNSRIIKGLLLFNFICSGLLKTQTDFTLYSLDFNPHRVEVNPAFIPQADFYLGLPGLSNIYGNFSNNSFTYRDLIRRKSGTDSIYFDFNSLLNSMRKTNFITAQATVDWLSFGWLEGRYYISGNITEKLGVRTRFSRELIETAVNGNGPKIGETIDLGNLFINASHYREYALRVSRDFNCKLRIGITAKLIQGIENMDIKRSDITLNTAPVTFDLTGKSDILINTSGLKNFTSDSLTSWNYLFGRSNYGWGIDAGGSYDISDKLSVAASLIDVGRIRWKYQPVNYYTSSNQYSYSGFALNQLVTTNSDTIIKGGQNYLDSLGNSFNISERNESYTSNLPSRFYLYGKYSIKSRNDITALIFGNVFKNRIYPSVSVGFTKRFSDVLEFNTNWSLHNNSIANLGAGFAFNLGLTQIHIATDNILGLIEQYHTRSFNIRAGITLVADYEGERESMCDYDHDGVSNSKDKCPDVAGPIGLNGCPDSDSDGIADNFDECPREAGTLQYKGCPDRDADQVVDKLDKCPDQPGRPELNGCPDRDNDGIADWEDDCPNLKGLMVFKGCPDRDSDSIPDKEDLCPDFAGSKLFGGCPDTDGDLITDKDDDCPELAGLRELNGCPDQDADGVADPFDLCPTDSGTISMKGCPYKDRDNDGIRDERDACPSYPGPAENKGCPLVDQDQDGVADIVDKCPTKKGLAEYGGCPALKDEDQEILDAAFQNLRFESGHSEISSTSLISLENLAKLIRSNQRMKLLISGHTDNTGDPAANILLSKNRSLAVKKFILQQGVKTDQIITEWFGQTRPIGSNLTAEGRKKNRRVELSIIE
jgi:outer membrane protein OmpA-like peptidoglycan-associated protein